LESSQTRLARRIFGSVLAAASIFGANTIYFTIIRNMAQSSASQIEVKEALAFSIEMDKSLFYKDWTVALQECNRVESEKCISAVADLIIHRNRTEDYTAVLINSLNYGHSDMQVTSLSKLVNLIDLVFKDDFGLSLEAAKKIGIQDPKSYAYKIQEINPNNAISVRSSKKISESSQNNFQYLTDVVESLNTDRIQYKTLELRSTILYIALVIMELFIFFLISSIDLWNTSVTEGRKRKK